ncbi:hypothetical protein D9M71_773430 [compost metagenome]
MPLATHKKYYLIYHVASLDRLKSINTLFLSARNYLFVLINQRVNKVVGPNLGRESQLEETMVHHADFQKNLG